MIKRRGADKFEGTKWLRKEYYNRTVGAVV
jgi:hypothetical protein